MIDHINETHAQATSSRSRTRSSSCTATSSSIINQREVGQDTDVASSARCARVLRQDPDVILIGEMRDPETVETALSARPRPATSCSRRCTPSTRPRPSTASSTSSRRTMQQQVARDARRHAARASSRSASCRAPTAGPRRRLRGPAHDRPRARHDHGPGRRPASSREVIAEGDYYGMQTFDQALFTTSRPAASASRRRCGRHEPARLQAAAGGRRPRGTTMATTSRTAATPPAASRDASGSRSSRPRLHQVK